MIYLKKLMMTLVLLMTAATGAWAGHAVPYMVGDENNTDLYFSKKSNVLTIQEGQEATFEFTNYTGGDNTWNNWVCSIQASDYQHIADIRADRWDNVAQNGDNYIYCNYLEMLGDAATFKAKMQGATVVLKAIYDQGKIRVAAMMTPTSGDPLVMVYEKTYTQPQAKVCLTIDQSHLVITKEEIISYVAPTESANEWELAMPAGNVLLNVAYKTPTTMALTFGGAEIPTAGVTGFLGFEQEFTDALAMEVKTKPDQGDAKDVTTTAASFTISSNNADVIAFQTDQENIFAQSGTLDKMKFKGKGTATLTIKFNGDTENASYEKTLLVTIEKKTYTVTLDDGDVDTQNWSGHVNDGNKNINLPIKNLEGGEKVTLTYGGRLKVKSVTATTDAKPTVWDGDLSKLTSESTAEYATATDGMTIKGTLAANVKVSIAADATVTLDGVTINGEDNEAYMWAGLNCLGDATIILKDGTTNTVKGFYRIYPGIHVPDGSTLTITGGTEGNGKLTASSYGYGAGIGGGSEGGSDGSCGNITITGGDITAKGGVYCAGIGGGLNRPCGNITISGGTVTATGGPNAAGIGGGSDGSCGNITIASTVTRVTATKGEDAPHSIGMGVDGSCGTVTIGGSVTGGISESPYNYPPSN